MKKQTLIGMLSLSAMILLAANWLLPGSASGDVSVKERDYQMVTAPIENGGDALYILDLRSGQIAVFTYDPSARGVVAAGVRNASDGFVMR
jgi:hypothetical protein